MNLNENINTRLNVTLFIFGFFCGAITIASFGGLIVLDWLVRVDEKRLRNERRL